jgi:ActD protein
MSEKIRLYGLMAEFDDPSTVVGAARAAHEAGYRRMDAYSPYPIEELWEAIDFRKNRLPLIVLIGGVLGCLGGFALCYWASTTAYPLNIGGRPLNSWPAFIPVTFECTILLAALSAVFGMLGLNGLPQPYHPVFNVEAFDQATRNRFFLLIEARDPKFDVLATREFLAGLGAKEVSDVEV